MMIILFLPPAKRSIKVHNDNSLLMPSYQWCYDSITKVQSLFIYHVLSLMYLSTNIALFVCHDHIYYLLISLLLLLFESRDEILLRGGRFVTAQNLIPLIRIDHEHHDLLR
jgi:membrane protein YdbS with pleckstrin-like domain